MIKSKEEKSSVSMKDLSSWKASMQDKNSVPLAIISLPEAETRRDALIVDGFPADWVVNYWPATDMRSAEQADLEELDMYRRIKQKYGRVILPGEIGCLLSHMAAIKWFYEESAADFLVVFEDDILPTRPDFVGKLSELVTFFSKSELKEKAFICHLGPRPTQWKSSFSRKIFSAVFADSEMAIYQHIDNQRGLWRAHAYIVSREAAARYSSHSYSVDFLADDWLKIKKKLAIDLLFVAPRIFSQNTTFGSMIDEQGQRQVKTQRSEYSLFRELVQIINERSLIKRLFGSVLGRMRRVFVLVVRSLPCKRY